MIRQSSFFHDTHANTHREKKWKTVNGPLCEVMIERLQTFPCPVNESKVDQQTQTFTHFSAIQRINNPSIGAVVCWCWILVRSSRPAITWVIEKSKLKNKFESWTAKKEMKPPAFFLLQISVNKNWLAELVAGSLENCWTYWPKELKCIVERVNTQKWQMK